MRKRCPSRPLLTSLTSLPSKLASPHSAQSTLTNKSRLKLLQQREEHLQDLFSTARDAVDALARDEGRYAQFLEGAIVQGYLHLLEPAATVHARAKDVALAERAAGAAAGYGAGAYGNRPSSPPGEGHDGASMMSRTSDAGPFSGADAAIMANAFRQALRKPDFADRPVEEGESPDDQHGQSRAELINLGLAEEGRDIRSVSSSRGVRVETLSDDGNDTATVQH